MFAISSRSRFYLYAEAADMGKGVKFTLRVSAGLQGLEPFAYVTDVPSRMATHPYKQLEELLPQNGKPAAM